MSIRAQALRSGAYLSIRELLGIVIRLLGTLVVTRLIGPENYGLYAGPLAAVTFLAAVAQLGVGVYLIRARENPSEELYDTAFTMILGIALIVTIVCLGGSLLLPGTIISDSHLAPFRALILVLPINVLWAPAQARLERGMRFRSVAWLELSGDLVLYGVAISLAISGAGVWAPVAGYAAWQMWLLLASYAAAGYRPRLRWDREATLDMTRYGSGYASASWIYQMRELSGPAIVGTMLGPRALGYAALALRIGETLCFVSRATWRLSVVVLARLQDDLGRLAVALREGMALQVIALGPLLGGFALIGNEAVPRLFGSAWRPTVHLLPLVLLSYLLTSIFNLEGSILSVRRLNRTMIVTNVLRISVLFGVAAVLVPRLGVIGWAWAMAVHPVGFLWCDRRVRRMIEVRYGPTICWLAAFVPPLFAPFLELPASLLLWAPAAVVLSTRWARVQLREYAGYVKGALLARRSPKIVPASAK